MKTFELIPTNGRKSFHRKCIVIETPEGHKYLRSYNTIVAVFTKEGTFEITAKERDLSKTTLTHIKEFQIFCNVKKQTKKDMIKTPIQII